MAGILITHMAIRDALRDRLRAVQCPSEMIDRIGGWASGKIGEGYGEGFSMQACNYSLRKMKCQNFSQRPASKVSVSPISPAKPCVLTRA